MYNARPSFQPTISEDDLYLFGQGNERRIYEKMGAHPHHPQVTFRALPCGTGGAARSVVGINGWIRHHPARAWAVRGVGIIRARLR